MKYRILTRKLFITTAVVPLLLLLSIVLSNKAIYYSSLVKTKGTVIAIGEEFIGSPWNRGFSKYHKFPIIDYKVNDRMMNYHKSTEFLFKTYNVGDEIGMVYERNNPKKVYIDSFFGFWITAPFLIIAALILFAWTGFISILYNVSFYRVSNFIRRIFKHS